MDEKLKIYLKKSHELALKQLMERFCFEMEANEKLFGLKDISLDKLKNDYHSKELFTDQEYQESFKESKKLVESNVFFK